MTEELLTMILNRKATSEVLTRGIFFSKVQWSHVKKTYLKKSAQ